MFASCIILDAVKTINTFNLYWTWRWLGATAIPTMKPTQAPVFCHTNKVPGGFLVGALSSYDPSRQNWFGGWNISSATYCYCGYFSYIARILHRLWRIGRSMRGNGSNRATPTRWAQVECTKLIVNQWIRLTCLSQMYLQIFNANFLQLPFRVIEDPLNYCTLNLADHTLRSPDVFIRTGGYTPAAQNFTPLAPYV